MAIATGTGLALAGGAMLGAGAMNYFGGKAQADAAKDAAAAAAQQIRQGAANASRIYGYPTENGRMGRIFGRATGRPSTGGAAGAGSQAQPSGADLQNQAINQGTDAAKAALTGGNERARADYLSNADAAQSRLLAGYGQARDTISPLAALSHYGEDALTGKGFETSPGYQFRLDQGNQALARASAASGGRIGGAALKKLSEYNQGFASNEFNNWANRAMHLGDVGYGATNTMAGLYSGEGQDLANLGMQRGTWLGNFGGQEAASLSNLEATRGQNLANVANWAATGAANAQLGAANAQAQLAMVPAQYAGQGYNAIGSTLGNLGTLAMFGAGSGMFGGGNGGSLPYDAQLTQQGLNSSNLAAYYNTPNVPMGFYK